MVATQRAKEDGAQPGPDTSGPGKEQPEARRADRETDKDGEKDAKERAEKTEPGDLDDLLQGLNDREDRRTRTADTDARDQAFHSLRGQFRDAYISLGAPAGAHGRLGRKIARKSLERIRRLFVQPNGYAELRRRIERSTVLILRAPVGTGRRYATMDLLGMVSGGRVWHVPGTWNYDAVRDADLEEDSGYFWDGVPDSTVGSLDVIELDQLATRLSKRNSYAIIIATTEWAVGPGLAPYVGELTEGPPAMAVIERFLTVEAGEQYGEDRIRRVLDDPQVLGCVDRMVRDRCPVEDLVRFAMLLTSVVAGDGDVVDACEAAEQSRERLSAWFTGLTEPEDRSFAVALAALHELPLPRIAAAARAFDHRVQQLENPDDAPRTRVFERTTQALLDSVEGIRSQRPMSTMYGAVPADSIRSRKPDYPARLLRLLWEEYPNTHPALIGWLGELVGDSDGYIRASAATATGLLASIDFSRVHDLLLSAWACSFTKEDRYALVAALRVTVLNPSLSRVVWEMLEDWSDEESQLQLQMTAAAALGRSVGITDYGRALEILTKQAETTTPRLTQAVCQAMTELFGTDIDRAWLVLDTLADWVADPNAQRRQAGLAAFLQIALDLERRRRNGELWPMVFDLLDRVPTYHHLVTRLWREALNAPHFDALAIEALRRAVDLADRAPSLVAPLDTVTVALPASARNLRTIRYFLTTWATGDPPSVTAQRLLDSLPITKVVTDEAA